MKKLLYLLLLIPWYSFAGNVIQHVDGEYKDINFVATVGMQYLKLSDLHYDNSYRKDKGGTHDFSNNILNIGIGVLVPISFRFISESTIELTYNYTDMQQLSFRQSFYYGIPILGKVISPFVFAKEGIYKLSHHIHSIVGDNYGSFSRDEHDVSGGFAEIGTGISYKISTHRVALFVSYVRYIPSHNNPAYDAHALGFNYSKFL